MLKYALTTFVALATLHGIRARKLGNLLPRGIAHYFLKSVAFLTNILYNNVKKKSIKRREFYAYAQQ